MVSLMNLHTPGEQADWDLIRPSERNGWQKLASATGGLVTASNILSAVGLILVVFGLFEITSANYINGSLLIAAGRAFDLLDGYVAEITKTKSSLGEMIDATVDKFEIFAALAAIAIAGILPPLVIAVMIFISAWASVAALVARIRSIEIHPSLIGKQATAAIWLSIILFLFTNAFDELSGLISVLAYTSFALFAILGYLSAAQYSKEAFRSGSPVSRLVKGFDNFLIVLNSKSSNARRTSERMDSLKELLPTTPDIIHAYRNREKLHNEIHKYLANKPGKTLIFVGGGDGTVHEVVNALMESEKLNSAAVLPTWSGNANDFAYMLNGISYRRKLAKVLKEGRIVKIKPLKISTTHKNKTSVRYAACYASFGATAFAAHQLGKRLPVKKNWLFSTPAALILQEIWGVTDAFRKAPVFSAEINGEKITIFEESFMNGSRIAKIFTVPLKLTDNAYYHAHQPDKHPFLSRRVIQALTGRKFGNVISEPTSLTFNEPAISQFDGEVSSIEKNSKITVSLASRSIQAVSIKL
ncbi:CDP-alcohol phosphatidyltransferase family protein [Candidatus Parcubacteria bacterium]|nr:CDP-alcohol phosphatidyltransferase family protein [Candidatus Parcubacteria bacterium]